MAKRGPRTPAGKAAVALNAVRHGLGASVPVIPGVESEDDWQAFRAGLVDDLAPDGEVERALAERVATVFWRLRRVEAYEADYIAVSIARAPDDLYERRKWRPGPATLDDARAAIAEARAALDLLATLPETGDVRPVDGDVALLVLDALAGGDATALPPEALGLPAGSTIDVDDGVPWSRATLKAAWLGVAAHRQRPPVDALRDAFEALQSAMAGREAEAAKVESELELMRRERRVPEPAVLQALQRYESHLNRQLYHALHELEAMRQRRAGAPTPMYRLQVHG